MKKSIGLKTAACILALTALMGSVRPADAYPYYVGPVTKIILKGVKVLPKGTIFIKDIIIKIFPQLF